MNLREATRSFVTANFGTTASLFEAVWDYYSSLSEEVASAKESIPHRDRLAIAGPEDDDANQITYFVVVASKSLGENPNAEDVIHVIKTAADKVDQHNRILERLYEHLRKYEPANQAPSTQTSQRRTDYARMWSWREAEDGRPLSKADYRRLLQKMASYDIFIADRGESHHVNHLGRIWIRGILLSSSSQKIAKRAKGSPTKRIGEKDAGYGFTPLTYRILVYALKRGARGASLLEFAEHCWFDKALVEDLRKQHNEAGKFTEVRVYLTDNSRRDSPEANRVRGAVVRVSLFLHRHLGAKLTSERHGVYLLTPCPRYCLVEVTSAANERFKGR